MSDRLATACRLVSSSARIVALPATVTPTPAPVVTPQLTDFRDVRRPADINAGPDLGGTGHAAMNFTGSVAAAGDTWITVYDQTPADGTIKNILGNVSLTADVLIHSDNNEKGAGLVALFNEGAKKKGLALAIFDSGNSDSLVLGTVSQATGTFTAIKTVALGGAIQENVWYRLTMDVLVSGTTVTVTGKVFEHATPTDPDSGLGAQVGATLIFAGKRPSGVDATGEIGMAASAAGTAVDSSVANFTIHP